MTRRNSAVPEYGDDPIDGDDYRVIHKNIGIDTRRLDSLSDNIYAVAMTLLVLDLKTNTAAGPLSALLAGLTPHLLVYVLSFLTLGVLWTAHLIQAHWLERISRTYIWIKIVFLMFIVLIPFSTQVLAAYPYEKLGVGIYGLNYLACTALLLLLWTYATDQHRLVRDDLSHHVIAWVKARLVVANAFAAVALVVAVAFSTRAGAALFILAQILAIIPTLSIDKVIVWSQKTVRPLRH
jgi:TMEM175 potassium channel family protein